MTLENGHSAMRETNGHCAECLGGRVLTAGSGSRAGYCQFLPEIPAQLSEVRVPGKLPLIQIGDTPKLLDVRASPPLWPPANSSCFPVSKHSAGKLGLTLQSPAHMSLLRGICSSLFLQYLTYGVFIHLSVHPSIRPSLHPFIPPSIHPYLHPFSNYILSAYYVLNRGKAVNKAQKDILKEQSICLLFVG